MKKLTICGLFAMAVVLLAPEEAQAQGTLYVTSLGQPSAGSAAVGSDSWQAEWIRTGGNPGGYVLDSVELDMVPASGAPNGFAVQLYSVTVASAVLPGSSLGTLSGSSDPAAGGLYTYTASGLTLSPSTDYYIVLRAGSPVASGAFAWNYANSLATSSGGWSGSDYLFNSTDGSSWNPRAAFPDFAVTATAVPEPDTLVLLGLPGLLFFARRLWHGKARSAAAK